MNKRKLYENIMSTVAREVKKVLNESNSDLSAEEKMELWYSGDRKLNVKACNIEKLVNYLNICIEFGYDECAEKLRDELAKRGINRPLEYEYAPVSSSERKILDDVEHAIRQEMEYIAEMNSADGSIYGLFDEDFIKQIERCETWSSRLATINGGDDIFADALDDCDDYDKYVNVCKKHNGEMTKIVNSILSDLKNHTW